MTEYKLSDWDTDKSTDSELYNMFKAANLFATKKFKISKKPETQETTMTSKPEKAIIIFIMVSGYTIFLTTIIAGIIILSKIHNNTQMMRQQNIELKEVLEASNKLDIVLEADLRRRAKELEKPEILWKVDGEYKMVPGTWQTVPNL